MTMSSAGATATISSRRQTPAAPSPRLSRYELQKRRDWQTFMQYLHEHRPPLVLARCSGAHVLEFLRYVDRFGKTRVHAPFCPSYGGRGGASTPACQCPLRQAWGSLDALVGRLRAAFDEHHRHSHGRSHAVNPFAARAVHLYLRGVRDAQARARGISHHKEKRKTKAKNDGAEANNVHGNDMSATADVDRVQTPRPPTATSPPLVNGTPFECSGASNVVEAYGGSCLFYSPLFDAFKF